MYITGGDPTVADTTLAGSYVQVFTHVLVAALIIYFYVRRYYYGMSIAMATFFPSTMYHICKAGWYCFGLDAPDYHALLPLDALVKWRLIDHICSTHTTAAVVLIAAFGDGGGGPHALVYRLLLVFFTVFSVIAFPFGTRAAILTVLFAVLLVAMDFLFVRHGRLPPADRFRLKFIIPALVSAAIGFLFFFEISGLHHEISHGLWHVFIFITLALIIEGVAPLVPNVDYFGNPV